MFIDLKCPSCKELVPTSVEQLFDIWKAGYEQLPDDRKSEILLTAEIRCTCGHENRWDTPMFTYLFDVLFHEILSLED
jgi:hypothetical protein